MDEYPEERRQSDDWEGKEGSSQGEEEEEAKSRRMLWRAVDVRVGGGWGKERVGVRVRRRVRVVNCIVLVDC